MFISEAVQQFLADVAIGHSENTTRLYRVALEQFADHLVGEEIVDVPALDARAGVGFARHLAASGLTNATINSYTNAVLQFYHWLVLDERMDTLDEQRLRERLKALNGSLGKKTDLPELPSEDAVEAIMQAAYDDPGGTIRQNLCRLRNIALLLTMRVTGARVSELTNLRRGDLGEKAALVTGKGDKERTVLFNDEAWNALITYLDLRDGAGEFDREKPVFCRHDRSAASGAPMSTDAVRKMLKALGEKAGIDEPMRPHLFRHRAATHLLAATGDLAFTQEIMGHSDPSTTRHYARLLSERLRQQYAKAAPKL